MGYAALLLLVVAVLAILWFSDVRPPSLTMGAAALMLGAAGYAAFGSPHLPGQPRAQLDNARPALLLTGAREAFFGRFNRTSNWATISESYARRGDTERAAGVLKSAVRENPRNLALWTLYGNALADHGGGLTPAAQLAYDRAVALNPDHPGPRFFRALARARSGDAETAVLEWRTLLEDVPEGAAYRPMIEQGIVAFSSPQATS